MRSGSRNEYAVKEKSDGSSGTENAEPRTVNLELERGTRTRNLEHGTRNCS
jgi:hypothetical protein